MLGCKPSEGFAEPLSESGAGLENVVELRQESPRVANGKRLVAPGMEKLTDGKLGLRVGQAPQLAQDCRVPGQSPVAVEKHQVEQEPSRVLGAAGQDQVPDPVLEGVVGDRAGGSAIAGFDGLETALCDLLPELPQQGLCLPLDEVPHALVVETEPRLTVEERGGHPRPQLLGQRLLDVREVESGPLRHQLGNDRCARDGHRHHDGAQHLAEALPVALLPSSPGSTVVGVETGSERLEVGEREPALNEVAQDEVGVGEETTRPPRDLPDQPHAAPTALDEQPLEVLLARPVADEAPHVGFALLALDVDAQDDGSRRRLHLRAGRGDDGHTSRQHGKQARRSAGSLRLVEGIDDEQESTSRLARGLPEQAMQLARVAPQPLGRRPGGQQAASDELSPQRGMERGGTGDTLRGVEEEARHSSLPDEACQVRCLAGTGLGFEVHVATVAAAGGAVDLGVEPGARDDAVDLDTLEHHLPSGCSQLEVPSDLAGQPGLSESLPQPGDDEVVGSERPGLRRLGHRGVRAAHPLDVALAESGAG